jgi:hypothetical protein
MHGMVGTLVPHCYSRWSEAKLNSWVVSTWLKPLRRGKGRTHSLAHLASSGRVMSVSVWHVCEWFGDFSIPILRVWGFLLLIDIFLSILATSCVHIEGETSSLHTDFLLLTLERCVSFVFPTCRRRVIKAGVTPGFRRQTECKPCTCQDQKFTYTTIT